MARPDVTTILAAGGALLLAAGLLSQNTTGWTGIAAGSAHWFGIIGLVAAATMMFRRGIPASRCLRVGLTLVAAGLVTTAGGIIWVWSADEVPCEDMSSCVHPAAERFTLLGNVAATLLLLGAATLLTQSLVAARGRQQPTET